LVTGNKLTVEGKKRVETMVRSNDGFHISEVDLQLRGPGDIQGVRQSGLVSLRLTNIATDDKIIRLSREIARKILDHDPSLQHPDNYCMAAQLRFLSKQQKQWGLIS
jgi:ATP-dependent DNA helicase RecG